MIKSPLEIFSEDRAKVAHSVWSRAYNTVTSHISATVLTQANAAGINYDRVWIELQATVAEGALSQVLRPTISDLHHIKPW